VKGGKTLLFLLAKLEFYSHLVSWRVVNCTPVEIGIVVVIIVAVAVVVHPHHSPSSTLGGVVRVGVVCICLT
jgi:hypothetical protein